MMLLLSSYLWPLPKATRAPFLMCDKPGAASAVEDSLGAKHRGARLGEGRELEAADFRNSMSGAPATVPW